MLVFAKWADSSEQEHRRDCQRDDVGDLIDIGLRKHARVFDPGSVEE